MTSLLEMERRVRRLERLRGTQAGDDSWERDGARYDAASGRLVMTDPARLAIIVRMMKEATTQAPNT